MYSTIILRSLVQVATKDIVLTSFMHYAIIDARYFDWIHKCNLALKNINSITVFSLIFIEYPIININANKLEWKPYLNSYYII